MKNLTGIIVLLGSPNSDQGELYSVARERCSKAIKIYKQSSGYKILPTGGFGAHFNTTAQAHAFYLKKHLIAHGVPEQDILEFAASTNTVEDAALSWPIVARYNVREVIVVTSDYHAARAEYLFRQTYHDVHLTMAPCPTNWAACDLDRGALWAHEREALARLKRRTTEK